MATATIASCIMQDNPVRTCVETHHMCVTEMITSLVKILYVLMLHFSEYSILNKYGDNHIISRAGN